MEEEGPPAKKKARRDVAASLLYHDVIRMLLAQPLFPDLVSLVLDYVGSGFECRMLAEKGFNNLMPGGLISVGQTGQLLVPGQEVAFLLADEDVVRKSLSLEALHSSPWLRSATQLVSADGHTFYFIDRHGALCRTSDDGRSLKRNHGFSNDLFDLSLTLDNSGQHLYCRNSMGQIAVFDSELQRLRTFIDGLPSGVSIYYAEMRIRGRELFLLSVQNEQNRLWVVDLLTGEKLRDLRVGNSLSSVSSSFCVVGRELFLLNTGRSAVVVLDTEDGSLIQEHVLAEFRPWTICFDGEYWWIGSARHDQIRCFT